MTEAPHTISWTLESWGSAVGRVECSAPAGSPCRLICPLPAGEACESACPHERVDYGECSVAEWLTEEGPGESYKGDATLARSGPIEVTWAGDHYEWNYRG
jgi:hypothetical protein